MTVIAFISAIAMMNAHLGADCGMPPTYSVPMRQIRHKPYGECNICVTQAELLIKTLKALH